MRRYETLIPTRNIPRWGVHVSMVFALTSGCDRLVYHTDDPGGDGGAGDALSGDTFEAPLPSGQLISTFGEQGVVTFGRQNRELDSRAVMVTVDDRIVVTGSAVFNNTSAVFVAAFDGAGDEDLAFGDFGYMESDPGDTDSGNHIALTSDGDYLVAGSSQTAIGSRMGLIRFTSAGQPDLSFGPDGHVGDDGTGTARGYFWVEGDGGSTLVGGTAIRGDWELAVLKLGSDDTVDTSYGTNGLFTDTRSGDQVVSAGIASADGGMLLLYFNTGVGCVRRVGGDGVMDPNFGLAGVVRLTPSTSYRTVHVASAPDGRFVVVGHLNLAAATEVAVSHYQANGATDPSTPPFIIEGLPSELNLNDVIVDNSGRLILLGRDDLTLVALALTSDGAIDTSYGNDGWVQPPLRDAFSPPPIVTSGRALATAPNGETVVVGKADDAMLIFRLTP